MLETIPVPGARSVPTLSRRNYAIEFRHILLWAIVVGAIEGNIAGIVAYKTFNASAALTSLIWSIPVFMNTLNLFWSVYFRGRPRVTTMVRLALAVLVCVLSLGMTPSGPWWSGWLFAAQMCATHFFFSGLTTLRSSIWNVNYPKSHRGRIVGNLQTLRLLVLMLSGATITWLFDHDPGLYRYIYPTLVVVGLVSLLPIRRLRIRGENRELRHYRAITQRPRRPMLAQLVSGLREAATVMRQDRRFARYMNAQFLLGAAAFSTDGLLVRILPERLGFGYFASGFLMLQLPVIVMLTSIRVWAPLFDRVGALHFRVRNSACWVLVYAFTTVSMLLVEFGGQGVLTVALVFLVAGRVVQGFCQGGGAIAWSIGHLHFAPPHQADLYMSIHVALTGLRGMLVPLLSVGLNMLVGNLSFAVSLILALIACRMFWRLAQEEQSQTAAAAATQEQIAERV